MTQTGTGALSSAELEFLRMGHTVVLQRGPEQGALVLHDRTHLARVPGHAQTRIVSYLMTVSTDEPSQVQGISLLRIIRSGNHPEINLDKLAWQVYLSALPVKIKEIIVAPTAELGRERFLNFLAEQAILVQQFRSGLSCFRVRSDSTTTTRTILEQFGISHAHLPACFGGHYDYARFDEWRRERIVREEATASASIPGIIQWDLSSSTTAARSRTSHVRTTPLVTRNNDGKEGDETEEEFLRKRNALYSRRLYHRRNLELVSVQEQIRVLKERNRIGRADADRLEDLLRRARQILVRRRIALDPLPVEPPATSETSRITITEEEDHGATTSDDDHTPAAQPKDPRNYN